MWAYGPPFITPSAMNQSPQTPLFSPLSIPHPPPPLSPPPSPPPPPPPPSSRLHQRGKKEQLQLHSRATRCKGKKQRSRSIADAAGEQKQEGRVDAADAQQHQSQQLVGG